MTAALAQVPLALALAFVTGGHSALRSAGPQAARIEGLWWLMFWVCSAVFLLVMAALAIGLVRDRRPDEPTPGPVPLERRRRFTRVVAGATAVTALVLFVFLVASTGTSRALGSLATATGAAGGDALTIEVTGHQWWWEVKYLDPVAAEQVATANEIHIPAGRPVRVKTVSHDVIHSFWVPSLHGKRDLIPGRDSEIWIQADRPGIYRGQCAEYCGQQHAHMAFLVIAEPPARFASWLVAQRQPAATPSTPGQQRGQELFTHLQCALCHTVQGTEAGGRVGPDLTHVASRLTLAAGTLPNNVGHLAGWVVDPQTQKPGNLMPATSLRSQDLEALLAYLESLK